ncbi:hypothetical protein [Blastococcus brunescens]|uniref:ABC transmembrane type-1 domain-containing protein n=1 Tax=Blastococcus brunescens TaxID=1564165 RepID=A0ABZ1AU12_9ACTN|nr:hypothetical protein [Blastococcus sp. BMG 8361]WRL62068.1 hypothetical protein U6N30_18620 [Blastococcus sp. BMG 8361]
MHPGPSPRRTAEGGVRQGPGADPAGARLLLLDEPTAHLDDAARALVAEILLALRGTVTTLLVTHDPALAALADRTVDLPAPEATPEELPAPSVPRHRGLRRDAARRGSGRRNGTGSRGDAAGRGRGDALLGRRGRADRGVGLADRPGRRDAADPHLVGRDRRRALLRHGPGAAALAGTAHRARRRAARRRRHPGQDLGRPRRAGPRRRPHPGSALARVVGDVGVVQDLTVRVRTPMLVAGAVTTGTAAALALVDPGAAGAVAVVLALTAGLVVLLHRRVDAGAARADSTLRVAALEETTTVLHALPDLRAHGLADRVAGDLDRLADRQAAAARTGSRAAAMGTGLIGLGTGLAAVLATAVGAGRLDGPALAVLALAPLALAEPLAGFVGALQRRGALADARARLDAVLTAPVPADPPSPCRSRRRCGSSPWTTSPPAGRPAPTSCAGWPPPLAPGTGGSSSAAPPGRASRRCSPCSWRRCGLARAATHWTGSTPPG